MKPFVGFSKGGLIRRRIRHIAILTFMWILTTIRTAVIWYYLDSTYIANGATQDDAYNADTSNDPTTVDWYIYVKLALQVNVLIAEAIMVCPVHVPIASSRCSSRA